MQQLAYVTTHCYGLATKTTRPTSASRYDRPAAFNDSTDLSCPQWPSSCIQRFDWPQLSATAVWLHPTTWPTSTYPHQTSSCISTTRPSPATLVECLAAHNHDSTIPAIDVTHPSWRPHTTATDIYIHVCNSGNKIFTFVVSVISPFVFLHCLWLSLLACIKLKFICGADTLIGSATKIKTFFSKISISVDIQNNEVIIDRICICLMNREKEVQGRSWKFWEMESVA